MAPLRLVAALGLITLIAGCGIGLGIPPARGGAVDPNQREPIIASPNGGPPIECRGIPRERCEVPGTLTEDIDAQLGNVVRVIVSCTSARCDERNGEFRVDLLLAGSASTQEHSGGAYGSTETAP